MGNPRKIHRKSMGNPSEIHGKSMGNPWEIPWTSAAGNVERGRDPSPGASLCDLPTFLDSWLQCSRGMFVMEQCGPPKPPVFGPLRQVSWDNEWMNGTGESIESPSGTASGLIWSSDFDPDTGPIYHKLSQAGSSCLCLVDALVMKHGTGRSTI